jgi:hypothetical protein
MLTACAYAPGGRFFTLWGAWVAGLLFLSGFVGGYFGLATGALHLAGLYALVWKVWPSLGHAERQGFSVRFENEDATLYLPGKAPLRLREGDAYYECPGCLVVHYRNVGKQVLPQRAFSPEQWQQLFSLVRGQIKPLRATTRRILEALALAVAIGFTVFWALGSQP